VNVLSASLRRRRGTESRRREVVNRGAVIMAKPRVKSRSKAILRLVVAGVALYVLFSLYESRKHRELAVTLADRVGHGDDHHARHQGATHGHVGAGRVHGLHHHHEHSMQSGSVHADRALDGESEAHSRLGGTSIDDDSAGAGKRLVEPVARGGSAQVPQGWMASTAHRNARKDADCNKGPHADDGGRFIDVLPRLGLDECVAAETIPGLCVTISQLMPEHGEERAVLIAFDDGHDISRAIAVAKTAAGDTGAKAVLVAARTEAAAASAARAGVPHAWAVCDSMDHHEPMPCHRPQFAIAAAVLALGVDVLLVGHGVSLAGPNPLFNLPPRRGADVEGVPAHKNSLGAVIGMHDPAMGWSAYSQSMAVPHLMSSFVVFRATAASARVAAWLGAAEDTRDADVALTDELLLPAYDARVRSGATFRVLPSECFSAHGVTGSVAQAAMAFESVRDERRGEYKAPRSGEDPNAILTTETFDDARRVVLRDGPISDGDANGNCAAIDPKERIGPAPRKLRLIAEPTGPFPVSISHLPHSTD
jgi:hypothetical protein